MLGKKQDGFPISLLVLLDQILDGVHQQTLAFDVAGIVAAQFSLAAQRVGQNGNSENLSQKPTSWIWMPGENKRLPR